MNRLLGLAVLLVVLYMCVPSYGTSGNYFLIYNVSCTMKGANGEEAVSIPLKGYLVADINNNDGNIVDANLILYGKDNLDNNRKTYVQFNYLGSDPNLNVKMDIWWQGSFFAFDIWDYNDSPFDFEVYVFGKWTWKNIGYSSTEPVASSLSGPISVWDGMLLDPNDELMGTGNTSVSLWLAETKIVNANNWTQDEIINGTAGLMQKLNGYTQATLPPP